MNDASYLSGTGESSWLAQDLTQALYQSQRAHLDLSEMIAQGVSQQEIHMQYQVAYNLTQRVNELYQMMHEQHAAIASGKENGYQYNPHIKYSQRVY